MEKQFKIAPLRSQLFRSPRGRKIDDSLSLSLRPSQNIYKKDTICIERIVSNKCRVQFGEEGVDERHARAI